MLIYFAGGIVPVAGESAWLVPRNTPLPNVGYHAEFRRSS